MNSNIDSNNKSKLRWSCRRGMLELDVLLGKFLEERYDKLSLEEQKNFIALLDESDPELFTWIMGHEAPKDVKFNHITEIIRLHAQSRV